jgi:hypothetical protein
MLKPPLDAQEAFSRLAPDLEEIAHFINTCPLTRRERMQLANLLSDHFRRLAVSPELSGVRLVGDAEELPDK